MGIEKVPRKYFAREATMPYCVQFKKFKFKTKKQKRNERLITPMFDSDSKLLVPSFLHILPCLVTSVTLSCFSLDNN